MKIKIILVILLMTVSINSQAGWRDNIFNRYATEVMYLIHPQGAQWFFGCTKVRSGRLHCGFRK